MQQILRQAHVSCGAGRTQEEAERRAEDADAEREAEEERQQRAQMEYYMSMMAQQNAAREDRSGARSPLRLRCTRAERRKRAQTSRGACVRRPSSSPFDIAPIAACAETALPARGAGPSARLSALSAGG
jgi:hypothetical protein